MADRIDWGHPHSWGFLLSLSWLMSQSPEEPDSEPPAFNHLCEKFFTSPRPVDALRGGAVAPLGRCLHFLLVRPLRENSLVVAGVPFADNSRIGGDLSVGEAFQRTRVIVLGVGETYPSVDLGRHQNETLVG